jgi:hypothetical protein
MKAIYYIKRFWVIPQDERSLLLKGISLCLITNLCVCLLPLKYYIQSLRLKPKFYIYDESANDKIKLLKNTMNRIDKVTPWRNSCFVRSIVFKKLISNYGIDCNILLGVKTDKNKLYAHAYVRIFNNVQFLRTQNINELIEL